MEDPNTTEYRQLVDVPDQLHAAVGALIEGTCLSKIDGNDDYNIVTGITYGQTLDHLMGQVVCITQKRPVNPLPHITPGYRFKDCILVAKSTCFYIGNGLIVAAGHSIFKGAGPIVKPIVAGMKVVFGLTDEDCNKKKIPAAKVFGIERVCFGQNEPFLHDQPNADRADWAILKLSVDPMSGQLPAPLTLRKWVGSEQINGAWTVGHPWGIGLTKSSPPNDKGYARTNGENSLLHNLYITRGSSGGPLFSKENEVIGLVSSGPGDELYGRGFIWPLDTKIIPFIAPNQTFGATKTNIWRSLTHPNAACFVGLLLPSIPATAAEKQLVVEILFGDGDETGWSSVTIINQANVPNDSIRTITDCTTIMGANPNFRPWLIRAIRITFTHPEAAEGGEWTRKGGFEMPKIPALIFGCRDPEDQTEPANWTILLSEQNTDYQPAVAKVVECPIFLPRAWKTITNNHIGPLSLTGPFSLKPWQAARPRN